MGQKMKGPNLMADKFKGRINCWTWLAQRSYRPKN